LPSGVAFDIFFLSAREEHAVNNIIVRALNKKVLAFKRMIQN
jgi:hypothetical protein